MHALIYEREDRVGVGALDVAGRPLLHRQLQALRDLGIEDVVVEVCEGDGAVARAGWLLESDPLTFRTIVIPSAAPLGIGELARRAGLEPNTPFLALSAETLMGVQLDLSVAPARYELEPPTALALPRAELTVESLALRAPGETQPARGWGVRITSAVAAHELGCAALAGGAPGIMIHGAEIKPGVWAARGARIAPDAAIHGPALFGSNVVVLGRARVGPRAIVGDRAVIERDAVVNDATVAADTIVGESAHLRRVQADAQGTTSFADGSRSDVSDALLLSPRTRKGTTMAARAVATFALLVLALPWLLLVAARQLSGKRSTSELPGPTGMLRFGTTGVRWLDTVPGLVDVLLGRRDLVGVNDRRVLEVAFLRGPKSALRTGAFDISARLAPGASTSTLLRMWRWYSVHKSDRLDRRLMPP